jgi:hypothetical protein
VQVPQVPHQQRRIGAEHLPLQLEHDLLLPRLQHEGLEGALQHFPHRHHGKLQLQRASLDLVEEGVEKGVEKGIERETESGAESWAERGVEGGEERDIGREGGREGGREKGRGLVDRSRVSG